MRTTHEQVMVNMGARLERDLLCSELILVPIKVLTQTEESRMSEYVMFYVVMIEVEL